MYNNVDISSFIRNLSCGQLKLLLIEKINIRRTEPL